MRTCRGGRCDAVWLRLPGTTAVFHRNFSGPAGFWTKRTPFCAKPSTEPARLAEFTTFMRAYKDMVFSTATRLLGNDAQAEDISQEVFVRAYAHFDELRAAQPAGAG